MAVKENIKENKVPATLFVGLGGIGSSVVRKVAEKCRGSETENVNFIVFDTNVNDLNRISGSGKKIYCVQTSNTQSVGDYLDYDKDALDNWFPKNAVLYDKTVSEGAGQVRAISRLALNATLKTGKIKPLFTAIDELFRKDGKAMKQALRVVIVSTAAGGTGSGITLPMAMYIRNYINEKYPNTAIVIRGLLMLPEILDSVIGTEVEKDSLRRNAYATVKEINAFMMKGSGFFDIDGDLQRYSDLHIDITAPATDELQSLALLPFDFCFLFDGQNAEDSTLTSKDQYLEQAAQALFEQNIGPMQQSAFSIEDNIIKEICTKGNYGRNRFGGIGAGVLRYPYEDVADYIAYQWAIDRIGGEGEAAKWSKYDKAYELKFKEERKKGVSLSEMQTRGEVYTRTLKNASDSFSKDLRNYYLNDAERRITDYFKKLAAEMHRCLSDDPTIRYCQLAVNNLAQEVDYSTETGSENRGHAVENLENLRSFEHAMRSHAKKVAESVAEGIFFNEGKTINEKREFTLEYALKAPVNGICHPNAMRYMLYLIETQMEEKIKSLNSKLSNEITPTLEGFSDSADSAGDYDAGYTKKSVEKTIDDLCRAEKGPDQEPSLFEKFKGYEEIYQKINTAFVGYYEAIREFGEITAELAAYNIGVEYIKELSDNFESFFDTFPEKVTKLLLLQDDLVNAIRFNKGDSVYNICAERPMLAELARTATNGEEGLMLPSDLNGEIFDAVKANVAFERETRVAEVVEEDRRIDIFDSILLGYFKKAVRRNCDSIDLNVIEAMAMEYRLQKRIQAREEQESEGQKIFDRVSHEDTIRHINEVISKGARLSAPGIQRIKNVEPREINVCAYNESLKDMRAYRMGDLVPNGLAVDTISKYELHFFNALYNLTPDKLSKFACPVNCETGCKNAGLYHSAYHRYSENIGPDSAKSMVISTHIDKRWDSIAVLPELDLDYQAEQMHRINQALLYGLLYDSIQYREVSQISSKKKIYKMESSEERISDLIVSNGTQCDQFYEILDALYINPAAVKDIFVIRDRKRRKDKVKRSNYVETSFAKALENFQVDSFHTGKTSLFEVALMYFASLPNSKRYDSEISSLIDSIIDTFREELSECENQADVPFYLCTVLEEQFGLLLDNFNQFEVLRSNTHASNNVVLDTVYRKIKAQFEAVEPVDFEESIARMKARII